MTFCLVLNVFVIPSQDPTALQKIVFVNHDSLLQHLLSLWNIQRLKWCQFTKITKEHWWMTAGSAQFSFVFPYFSKNLIERCENMGKWWIYPFVLVLYTITCSSANKCLFLKSGAHLFEWLWLDRSCLWSDHVLLRFRIMVDNLERHLSTVFC